MLLNVYLKKNCGFVNVRSYTGDLLNWWAKLGADIGILEISSGRQSWVL